jgi:hypothetical protein
MGWPERSVFCGIHADGCAHNNGYNNITAVFSVQAMLRGYKRNKVKA